MPGSWLGGQAGRHRKSLAEAFAATGEPRQGWRALRDGVVVGVTNPKSYILFGAVLPQFVNRAAGNVPGQMLLLSVFSVVIGAVSDCGWDSATNDGTSFASPPPYPANPLPKASQDQVLNLSVDSMADGCSTFNWTTQTGSCSSSFTGSFDAYSGSGIPSGCESVLSSSQANRTVILVPVYNSGSMCGRGEDGSYTLVGFAAFVVTGYHLPGFTASDWLNSANNCTGSQECVNGYFTQAVIPATGTIGGQDMGASIVQLTG